MEKRFNIIILMLAVLTFSYINVATADSSCTGGGTKYVCGHEQVSQSLADADSNCGEGFSTKKLVDVCSPNFQEYTIHE
jgi:hypothetical protein